MTRADLIDKLATTQPVTETDPVIHQAPGPCRCVGVGVQEYQGQVQLRAPAWSSRETICVDACLALEITALWAAGVVTTGCCCGHGKAQPFIGVSDRDIPRMKAWGYRVQPNPCRPGDEDSFWPKSITTRTGASDMARKRKAKPHDPAAAERHRREREENAAEVARLRAMGDDVTVTTDSRTQKLTGAYRCDVVAMMARSGAISSNEESAVRKLQGLIEKANGASGSSLSGLDRVSGGAVNDAGLIRHTEAARELVKRERRMDPMTWLFLRELCDGNLISTRWRGVVERRTGETQPEAQSGAVRQAFRTLACVEELLIREPANDDLPNLATGTCPRG